MPFSAESVSSQRACPQAKKKGKVPSTPATVTPHGRRQKTLEIAKKKLPNTAKVSFERSKGPPKGPAQVTQKAHRPREKGLHQHAPRTSERRSPQNSAHTRASAGSRCKEKAPPPRPPPIELNLKGRRARSSARGKARQDRTGGESKITVHDRQKKIKKRGASKKKRRGEEKGPGSCEDFHPDRSGRRTQGSFSHPKKCVEERSLHTDCTNRVSTRKFSLRKQNKKRGDLSLPTSPQGQSEKTGKIRRRKSQP